MGCRHYRPTLHFKHVQDDVRRSIPILHIGRVNMDRDTGAFNIHRDVPLPAVDLFSSIIPRGPTASVVRTL